MKKPDWSDLAVASRKRKRGNGHANRRDQEADPNPASGSLDTGMVEQQIIDSIRMTIGGEVDWDEVDAACDRVRGGYE